MIDLGPDAGGAARQTVIDAVSAAGLEVVAGGGVEDALAGKEADGDAAPLASAMAAAARGYGALACADATAAARQAIGIAAARQAAGRPVPELARAWAYVLLCADREGQVDAAHGAARRLRALGGSDDVPAAVWARYPEIDAIANRELLEVEVDAGVAGAAIWIDFHQVGASPAKVVVEAGDHVIAAASGNKRGWAAGTAVRSQKKIEVPMVEQGSAQGDLARRIAGWKVVTPDELAWVLGRVHARVAVVRQGDRIAAWGQLGRGEPPKLIAGAADDGTAALADAPRLMAAVAERVHGWNDHAPDPDRPLLTEADAPAPSRRTDEPEQPARWWVYAAIAGAAAIAGGFVLLHETASDRQRIELRYP